MRTDDPVYFRATRALFVITPEGHSAAWDPEVCSCRPRWVGLLLECPMCQTIFGHYIDTPMGIRER
jgi:hypothetical protein